MSCDFEQAKVKINEIIMNDGKKQFRKNKNFRINIINN